MSFFIFIFLFLILLFLFFFFLLLEKFLTRVLISKKKKKDQKKEKEDSAYEYSPPLTLPCFIVFTVLTQSGCNEVCFFQKLCYKLSETVIGNQLLCWTVTTSSCDEVLQMLLLFYYLLHRNKLIYLQLSPNTPFNTGQLIKCVFIHPLVNIHFILSLLTPSYRGVQGL